MAIGTNLTSNNYFSLCRLDFNSRMHVRTYTPPHAHHIEYDIWQNQVINIIKDSEYLPTLKKVKLW